MDCELLITLFFKVVIGILSILISLLLPKVKAWLETKIGNEELIKIEEQVKIAVQAAEQTLKEIDPSGQKRKEYVKSYLVNLGISSSIDLDTLIESAVMELNSITKTS